MSHKTIEIPLVDKRLEVYWGEEAWPAYRRAIRKAGIKIPKDEKCPMKGGQAYGSWIWIFSTERKNRSVFFHELSHFLSSLYEYLGCEDEEEFKAYLSEYATEALTTLWEQIQKEKAE